MPFLISLIILLMLWIAIFKSRKSALLYSFISVLIEIFMWTFGFAIQLSSANLITTQISIIIIHTGLIFSSPTWFIFTLIYINPKYKSIIKWIVAALIVPAFSYTVFLTNSWHHLYYKMLRFDAHLYLIFNTALFTGL